MQVNDDDWQLRTELAGNGDLYLLQVRGELDDRRRDPRRRLGGNAQAAQRRERRDLIAMINNEATVKTLRRVADRAWLMPQNPVYDPIPAQKAEILGKVATVLRRL